MYDYSGQMVRGYEINERIGAGSFGSVYRAFQPTIGREVAVKIILPLYANHPDFIRRFEAEAQLVARLEHPHIVPLFDYWREPEAAFLVMRLLPSNLRRRLEKAPIPLETAIQVIDQIASALAMSHRQGVVHRDVKPDNILLDASGNAYLTDFGLAKVAESSRTDDEERVAGSPAYMAPEQLTGHISTPQTDIYALGVVIYEMFMGETPFAYLSVTDLIAQKLKAPLPPVELPDGHAAAVINRVIQQATAADLALRYTDSLALAREFRTAMTGRISPVMLPDTADIENPYKGLRAFEEADAPDYFGREALVHQLVAALGEGGPYQRFLAVVGPSGSGKSSLVKAGLLPALRQGALPGSEGWYMATLVPGPYPLHQLETTLLSLAPRPLDDLGTLLEADPRGLVRAADRILGETDSDLILVIDQCEELFTLVTDEAARAHCLALLASAVTEPDSRLRVIVTLRADFYDRPLLYERFGSLMQARTQVVLPLTTSELERAIVAPAQRVGVQIEPNLVAAMIADVHEEPGALPLLQYALTEVFERRDGRRIRLQDYDAIGRAAGALARRADQVFAQLSPVQQAVAQQVFLRLVTLGEGTEDTRRRVERAELASVVTDSPTLQDVLDIFGRHRLLSFDRVPDTREPTVEVAHEALMREWGRLKGWLDNSREDVRLQRRLARLASEWKAAHHDPSYLLRGVQLQQFEYWLDHTQVSPSQAEKQFLTASIEIRERQQAEEAARGAREKLLEARARRFLGGLLVMMGLALVVALVLSVFAFSQREEAQDARQAAERNAVLAQSEAEAAATAAAVAERRADELQSLALIEDADRTLAEGNIDLALALALEANRIPNAPIQARRVLSDLAPLAAVRILTQHTDRVNTVAFRPDGTLALSGGDDGALLWWEIGSGELIRRLDEPGRRVRSVAFSPDGAQAVLGGDGGLLLVIEVASGAIIRRLEGTPGRSGDDIFAVAYSPQGDMIAAGGRDTWVTLWDAATGTLLASLGGPLDGHQDRITSLAFSPDGTLLASGGADARVIVWSVAERQPAVKLVAQSNQITDLAFSPNGDALLSASADASLIYWETARYTVVHRLQGHTERINGVAFSPDGRLIVSGAGNPFSAASTDNSLILWDAARGQIIRRYTGHAFQITDVAFSSDGHHVLTASADTTLRLWDIAPEIELARASLGAGSLDTAAPLPAGDRVLAMLDRTTLAEITLDPAAPEIRVLNTLPGVNAVAVSPDGTQLLTASSNRSLSLWDAASGKELRTLTGHLNSVNDVAFLPDGRRAVSVSRDRRVIVWNMVTGEPERIFEARHTNSINRVAVSPDGTQLLTASADQTLILWDVATGSAIRILRGHQSSVTAVAFHPNGAWAISGGQDKLLIVWDLTTGDSLLSLGASGNSHTDRITAVAFSPDGQQVWSGGRDRTVRLWDLANGQMIRSYAALDAAVSLVVTEPSGEFVVIVSADGRLTWLPASPESLIDWIESHRYVPPISCEERPQFQLPECPATGDRSISPLDVPPGSLTGPAG